jgi:amino acid transporter
VSAAKSRSDSQVSSELSRELTLFHITMMGLGMMIGAGVFLGIGNATREAGPGGMVLTFALNGMIAILTAMSYAELSSAVPRAGGAYNFARIGFGRGTSFIAGWMEWFASSVAGSLYAVVFGLYVARLLGTWGVIPEAWAGPIVNRAIALLIAGLFIYINYRGASETGKIGAIFTLGQTIFLVVIGIIGVGVAIYHPERMANFVPFMPQGWERLLVTMGLTYVAFEGYEVIAQAGDEAIEPRRNLPKAMIYSVFIVTVTYVLTAFATVVSVKAGPDLVRTVAQDGTQVGERLEPWQWIGQYGDTGFGEAVSRLIPVGGNLLLTLAVIFASTSALNATIYSATRASYALGRDRMLPAFFARIHSVRKTPWVALVFTGLIVMVVACLGTRTVAASASAMFLLLFFLVNVCVIKIRRNMGDELSYGYVMPFFPIPPLAAIACQLALLVFMHELSLWACLIAAGWVAVGAVVYVAYSRSRAVATEDEILVLEEERQPEAEAGRYRVMVPVANPKNAVDLVRNTYKLCRAKNASVELLHMVPVPEQVPLSDAEKYMLEGKEGIVEAMLYLAPQFPLSTTIRYCRNIARGIVSAVRQKRVNMLIMGWHGHVRRYAFRLGSTVDPVIERSPCDVVVMKNCSYQEYRRVLVPLAGGPNGALALEVATILAEEKEGSVTAFTVRRDGEAFDIDEYVEENAPRLVLPRERVITKITDAADVTAAILKEAEEGEYDLVVLGATRQPLLRQITRATVPDFIAQRCSKPLVMVKASGGIGGWIRRWI